MAQNKVPTDTSLKINCPPSPWWRPDNWNYKNIGIIHIGPRLCEIIKEFKNLTPERCPRITASPIATGPEPFISFRPESTVAKTVQTSWKVNKISIRSPWKGEMDSSRAVGPRWLFTPDGDTTLKRAVPTEAPMICAAIYMVVRNGVILCITEEKRQKAWLEN